MRPGVLLERLEERGDAACLVRGERTHSASELRSRVAAWEERVAASGAPPGAVVGIQADFSLDPVALLLALLHTGRVACLVPREAAAPDRLLAEARATGTWRWTPEGEPGWIAAAEDPGEHPLLERLRREGGGGLVVFTSGSTGRPKAVLHDARRFLGKFQAARKRLRTLGFLLFDHIAGQDTLFYTLAAGGVLVAPEARDPRSVCAAIERHRVEVLPVSPTFLRLLWLSGAHRDFDLSSLRIVTYGSEPMDGATLDRAAEMFPEARLAQKYGTTELGAPRARSRTDDGLWIRFDDRETRAEVREGLLWIRSAGAMLGYLNAPGPRRDGEWICTGDEALQEGDWIRVLGRRSDLINVGGEKVHPAEVEAAIAELEFVREVAVHGEPHALTGSVVCARVRLVDGTAAHGTAADGTAAKGARAGGGSPRARLLSDIRRHCRARLAAHKVPVKVEVVGESLVTARQKVLR